MALFCNSKIFSRNHGIGNNSFLLPSCANYFLMFMTKQMKNHAVMNPDLNRHHILFIVWLTPILIPWQKQLKEHLEMNCLQVTKRSEHFVTRWSFFNWIVNQSRQQKNLNILSPGRGSFWTELLTRVFDLMHVALALQDCIIKACFVYLTNKYLHY